MGIGDVDEVVEIEVGGSVIKRIETYQLAMGICDQPASFACRIGSGAESLADLKKTFAPRTPFKISIGGTPQFQGRIDDYDSHTSGSSASLDVRGRDGMAELIEATIREDETFKDVTYTELVTKCLQKVVPGAKLAHDNAANRKLTTGAQIPSFPEPKAAADSIVARLTEEGILGPTTAQKTCQAKVGNKLYEGFLKKELDRAGLFLWQAGDGTFVLSSPNATQPPLFAIHRKIGQRTIVLDSSHANHTAGRYSEAQIHYRAGGGKVGRGQAFGSAIDDEMTALGFDRPFVHKDSHAKSIGQASYLAHRCIAESRRKGWRLNYTVSGHKAATLYGGRAIWQPDTVIDIDDEIEGLVGKYWIESVMPERQPKTITRLVMMRAEDAALFATGEDE